MGEREEFVPYARRLKATQQAGQPVPLQYEHFPDAFQEQVVHALDDVIGVDDGMRWAGLSWEEMPGPPHVWEAVWGAIAREQGRPLPLGRFPNGRERAVGLIRSQSVPASQFLEAVELAFRVVVRSYKLIASYGRQRGFTADEAIKMLNGRFTQHDLGYRFDAESGMIVRVDSEYLHGEVVEPALHLLRSRSFAGAEQEFLQALRKIRQDDYEGAMVEATKAYESVMKQICNRRGWAYEERATAGPLAQLLRAKGFFPPYLDTYRESLSLLFESAVAKPRNAQAGHGQGSEIRTVPASVANLALHLTAAAIVFLVELDNEGPDS